MQDPSEQRASNESDLEEGKGRQDVNTFGLLNLETVAFSALKLLTALWTDPIAQ